MYLMAHGWGIQPGEFWEMTIPEWFTLFEHYRPRDKGDYAGNLTRGDVEELYDWALSDGSTGS